MKKDKSAAKPHRVKIKMPVGQRKTVYTNSVTNNIPVPMRKAISRNCTSFLPIPMSATTCRLCWKVYPFPQGAVACFVQLFLYPSDFALFADAGHHVAPSEYVEHPVGIDPPVAQAFFAGIGNHKDAQAVFPPLFSHLLPHLASFSARGGQRKYWFSIYR